MTRRIELLKALETTPRDLARALRGVGPTQSATRLTPDHWSIADILNHLLWVENRSLIRLQCVAEETNPTLLPILSDPANHDVATPLDDLLTRFTNARARTLAYLLPLSTGIWARPATLEDGQKTTFRFLVQALVDHDTERLNQLIETKNKLSRL